MTEHLRAYNSLWQVRSDSWCRLEEAADRLTRPTTTGAYKDKWASACQELLTRLSTLEPYWAYPGSPQFARVQRLFATGNYDKFAQAVGQINRALTTESYRSGDVENAGADDLDMFPSDPRQLTEHQPATQRDRPYFEVLVVEKMTEDQERALRNEVRKWRRPDDEFVYELVVVSSGDEALDRGTAQRQPAGRGDPSALFAPIDPGPVESGGVRRYRCLRRFGRSRDARGTRADPGGFPSEAAARARPVHDDRDRCGGHRRATGPVLPQGVSCPGRHARTSPVDPARRRGALPHPVLQRAQAVQSPAHRRLSRPADLAGQVDRQLALDQGHGRLLRPGRVHGRDVGNLRRSRLPARADRAPARIAAARIAGLRVAPHLLRHQRNVDRQQDRHAGPGGTGRHRAAGSKLPPVASLRNVARRGECRLPRGISAQ